MIPFNAGTEFKDETLTRLQRTISTEPVFIEISGKHDYAVYNSEYQMICFLQFAEKRETRYGPYEHFVRSIITQYTTYQATYFKPEEVCSLVSAIESTYRKQQESELTDKNAKEENERKFEAIKHKKKQWTKTILFCDSLTM